MPSTSPVVKARPELPAPVSAGTCQRTASRLPEWSPVHCMPQRCDAGPALHHERRAARIGVLLDAAVRGLAAGERLAVARADPGDVELAQAHAGLADLVLLIGERALRPEARLRARSASAIASTVSGSSWYSQP